MNMLMGMAKPTRSLRPERLAMAVLMPMISPWRLHQRAAAVAGIDARVGLQEVLNVRLLPLAQTQTVPPLGADDAEGDRAGQAEGAPHGEDEIAGLHAVAVAQRRGDQVDPSMTKTATSVSSSPRTRCGRSQRRSARLMRIPSGAAARTTCQFVST